MTSHTLLAVPVPEADALVRSLIRRWEPDFEPGPSDNFQAHVTVLGPFIPLEDCDAAALDRLRRLFAVSPGFAFRLGDVGTFPRSAVYLRPEPDEPFKQLTRAAFEIFPAHPPYSGAYDSVIPHMTVGPVWSPAMEAELVEVAARAAPIDSMATEVRLILSEPKSFTTLAKFPLMDTGNSRAETKL